MKSLGTFFGAFFVLSLIANPLFAKELRIYLACKLDDQKQKMPKEVSTWKVVKISKPAADHKEDAPKWENTYGLEVQLKGSNVVEFYDFKGTGGDQGYAEYEVVATDKDYARIGVGDATVNDRFAGANLIDTKGYSFASCEPEVVK